MKTANITTTIQMPAPLDIYEVLPSNSSGKTQDGDFYFDTIAHGWYPVKIHGDITNFFAVARKKIWNPEGLSEEQLKMLTENNRLLSEEEHNRLVALEGLKDKIIHKLYSLYNNFVFFCHGDVYGQTYATPTPPNYFLELPEEEFVNSKKESYKIAPEGFRLITNEDYIIRKGDKVWWNTSNCWNNTRGLEGLKIGKAYQAKAFATPITKPKFKVGDRVKVIHPVDGPIATIEDVRRSEDGSVKYDSSFGCLILKNIEENQVYKLTLVCWCLDTAPKDSYYIRSNKKSVEAKQKVFLVTGGFENHVTIDSFGVYINYQTLLENFEYSLDGKTDWKPCAIQVVELY